MSGFELAGFWVAQRFQRCDMLASVNKGFSPWSASPDSRYFSTFTPFQNATYPLICFAASFGSG